MANHSYKTVPTERQEKTYRCKVVGDKEATLFASRRAIKVYVRETSGGGFTLGFAPKLAKKIKSGSRYELHYDDRRVEVIAESFADTAPGEARLRVGTIREFEPKERWAFRLPFFKGSRVLNHESIINSGAAYGGFVLILFCVMSLPGIGEQLGTAPRIESAIHTVGENIQQVWHSFRQH